MSNNLDKPPLKEALCQSVLPGKILAVQVGLHRTGVLVETRDGICCGLSATLVDPKSEFSRLPSVGAAGHLDELPYQELVSLVHSTNPTEVSIGLAAVNALLPQDPRNWIELNAEDYLLQNGAEKDVAVIGHFPFVNRLRLSTRNLWVLELEPREGDLPARLAPEILPKADIVAITATTFINNTFDALIPLCSPHAKVMVLGPSTPLSPVLFQYRVDILSGTVVLDPERAMHWIGQGATLHQLRQANYVRLVTILAD